MQPLRLIDTDKADPAYTAALDEALLLSARGSAPPTLHLYRRDPPAVTLGYFLDAKKSVDLGYCKKKGIKVIRRISGGGAIYTDKGQLVYGLATRSILPDSTADCFKIVCTALARALSGLGCPSQYSPMNDVVSNGKKVSGSALHQKGKAKLMHGTILVVADIETMFMALKVSREAVTTKGLHAPHERVTSISSEMGHTIPMDRVKDALASEIATTLGLELKVSEPEAEEIALAEELVETKYSTDEWNLKNNK